MGELLLLFWKAKPPCNIACVDRDGCGVARGVAVSRVESGNQSGCEGDIRAFETQIGCRETLSKVPLLLIEAEHPLGGQSRPEEERKGPRRNVSVSEGKDRHEWRVERNGEEDERA